MSKIIVKGKTVQIPISRDRWESYDRENAVLDSVPSLLVFKKIKNIDIRVAYYHGNNVEKQSIDTIYIDESMTSPNCGDFRIIINNRHTKFEIIIDVSDIDITLIDES